MACRNCGYFVRTVIQNNICRPISRPAYQNHYETLNLKRDCTSKQIRDAFIKLSKENHPDVNKEIHSHEKFQKINEAYNVLSKPGSRLSYDLGLANSQFYQYDSNTTYSYTRDSNRPPWRYREYYEYRAQQERIPKTVIAIGCLLFMFFGVTLQFLAIRHAVTFKREIIRRHTEERQAELDKLKARAQEMGNDYQFKVLQLKLLGHTNDLDDD